MKIQDIPLDKSVYLFELDNVLFPRRDYIIQVYYLFASFLEFTEGNVKANDLAQFMKKIHDVHGEDQVFDTLKVIYGLDEKYRENLNRLTANAQIPLRLYPHEEIGNLLSNLIKQNKHIAILTKGNPVEQLNKLKFVEWGDRGGEIRNQMKIFFVDELKFKSLDPFDYIASEYQVNKSELIWLEELDF